MPAYLIAEIEVTDPEAYRAYTSRTPGVIARHGGRFVVRGGPAVLLEGAPEPARIVVIEFADRATAERFYRSAEYQEILPLRQRAARGRVVIVEGYAPPA